MPTHPEIEERARQVAAQLDLLEKELPSREKKIDQPIPAATVRFHVTKWVLWSYLGYAIGVGLFIMFRGESEKSALLIDIMKTLLLPIVTLVIGFYFGSKPESQ
jgi:hypothetical protein